ncbi:hypothetical protein ACHAXN_008858 [Cyclotella atomus]
MCQVTAASTKSMSSKPAFQGASFDKNGSCIYHPSVELAQQVKQDGKLLWKEIKMNCPKCCSANHKSRRVTSLGGKGVVKRGHGVHGMPPPLRKSNSGRHMDVEFDTPFDESGKCHHHPNVQMATKKVRGGWKILMTACPKCIEAKYEEDVESVNSGSRKSGRNERSSRSKSRSRSQSRSKLSNKLERDGRADNDGGSVSSRSTKRSVTSRTTAVTSSGKFDKNGCCTRHPLIQVAKKKLLGGWKEMRDCPKCKDPNYDDVNDAASATSKRSTSSRKSTRSVKSNGSRRGGKKTDRYGALPFDGEGFCHAHPGVRLAKKKALGGWKVLFDICPDCANDASSQAGSTRSRSSRKSGTGKYYDPSSAGSDASSMQSSKRSNRSSGSGRKKKIRVKDMKYRGEDGKEGRYSGDVNEDHEPHGQGKMKYKDGSTFTGVWSDGVAVHGKSSGERKEKKKDEQWSNADKPSAAAVKKVRKMKWMDYYGDPGEYTGEVNGENMPNGKGSMKYDHGLIQEGLWGRGQFVEGSDTDVQQKSGEKSREKRSSGSSSRRRESSSRNASGQMEP